MKEKLRMDGLACGFQRLQTLANQLLDWRNPGLALAFLSGASDRSMWPSTNCMISGRASSINRLHHALSISASTVVRKVWPPKVCSRELTIFRVCSSHSCCSFITL